jgi:cellulose synthase/poly-beta-1,6-N-acetylglucosamine synthase-like glycosyltransferase
MVIPTYNREHILKNTIDYALAQDYPNYEIIVVSQTEPHSADFLSYTMHLPPRVRIIEHRPPSSPEARNRGIFAASGEIILLIDDDVTIRTDFIRQHAKYYDDPTIVGVTGRVEQALRFRCKCPLSTGNEFLRWISNYEFQDLNEKTAFRAAGGNFSFRRSAAFQAGLYDSNFIGTAWGEEYDFSLRLRASAGMIIYNPDALIFHLNEPVGGVGNRNRFEKFSIYSKAHNLGYFIEKFHFDRRYHLRLLIYIYRQCFLKRDYLSRKGLRFIIDGNRVFFRGFRDGFRKARKLPT